MKNTNNCQRIQINLNGNTGYFFIIDSSDKAIKVTGNQMSDNRTTWFPKSGFEVTTSEHSIDTWTSKSWFSSKSSSFQNDMVFSSGSKSQWTRNWK